MGLFIAMSLARIPGSRNDSLFVTQMCTCFTVLAIYDQMSGQYLENRAHLCCQVRMRI